MTVEETIKMEIDMINDKISDAIINKHATYCNYYISGTKKYQHEIIRRLRRDGYDFDIINCHNSNNIIKIVCYF